MILYHTVYDMVYMFGCDFGWFRGIAGSAWERFICCTFIAVSGISLHFGSHKVRRGLFVFAAGCVISLITLLVMPSQLIRFGILSFLGIGMLTAAALEKPFKRVNPVLGLGLSLALFFVTYGVSRGFLGFGAIRLIALPKWLYSAEFLAFLGLPGEGFFSTDYFPLLPWLFLLYAGYFFWGIIKAKGKEGFFTLRVPVLQTVGRYTLAVYILHQPVIYGILFLIFRII